MNKDESMTRDDVKHVRRVGNLLLDVVEKLQRRSMSPDNHLKNGVDMTLFDMIEMLVDWKATTEQDNRNFAKTIADNVRRLRYWPQIATLLARTAAELGWVDYAECEQHLNQVYEEGMNQY